MSGLGGLDESPHGVVVGLVQGSATDCPYTFMHDRVAGRCKLPWDATIQVRDGTGCGFAAPERRYAGAEPNRPGRNAQR